MTDSAVTEEYLQHEGAVTPRMSAGKVPGGREDEVAEAIGDETAFPDLDPHRYVRVVAQDEVGARFDEASGPVAMGQPRIHGELHSPVELQDHKVDGRPEGRDILEDEVVSGRCGTRRGIERYRGTVVIRVAEHAHAQAPGVQQGRPPRRAGRIAGPAVGDSPPVQH